MLFPKFEKLVMQKKCNGNQSTVSSNALKHENLDFEADQIVKQKVLEQLHLNSFRQSRVERKNRLAAQNFLEHQEGSGKGRELPVDVPGFISVAKLIKLRREFSIAFEGVDDDVIDLVPPDQDVAPSAEALPLVGRPQPPRLHDVLHAKAAT